MDSQIEKSHWIYEWNVIFYTFTHNNLEIGTFKDLAKITLTDYHYRNVIVHMLIQTETMGSYLIQIKGNPHEPGQMTLQRLDDSHLKMSRGKTLRHFLRRSLDCPSKRKALIFGGHGCAWFLKTADNSVSSPEKYKDYLLPVTKISNTFRKLQIEMSLSLQRPIFDLLCFDCCLMSTIESIYQFRELVGYIIAYENYAGWDGIVEPKILSHFDNKETSTLILTVKLSNDLIDRVDIAPLKGSGVDKGDNSDPTDVSVLRLSAIYPFVDYLRQIEPLEYPQTYQYCIDPNYWHIQDLTSIVELTATKKSVDLNKYRELFYQFRVFYRQSNNFPTSKRNKKNENFNHGVSCLLDLEKDTYDPSHCWKQLVLRLTFRNSIQSWIGKIYSYFGYT